MKIKDIFLLIKFEKQLKNFDMKNWKTSLSGVLALLPALLHAVLPTVITSETALLLSQVFVSVGLVQAHDSKKNLND